MEIFAGEDYSQVFQILGLIGAGCYITAYGGLQLRLWHGTSLRYILINLTAASLVLVSLTANFNLASAIIQITWVCISLFGIVRTTYLKSKTRFSPEEAALLTAKLDVMPKLTARKFLDAGLWMDAPEGTVIATEGQPIGALFYLAEGTAHVTESGIHIGTCTQPSFIGEMTCLNGGPASATVVTTSPSRLFRIGSAALLKLCEKDADFQVTLKNALGEDTRLKLIAANQRITSGALA